MPPQGKTANEILFWSASFGLAAYWFYCRSQSSSKRQSWSPNKPLSIPSELLDTPCSQELQVAVELALQAGSNMTEYCDDKGTDNEEMYDLGIQTKGSLEDFCTNIDVENEKVVTDGILKNFPSHRIIGEESTGTGSVPKLTNEPTWIIDPIDGTTNFSYGLPLTCVSIGYCVDGEPVMGVIYAPMTNELFLAIKGHGAFRNGVRIAHRDSIGDTSNQRLADSIVCVEFGYVRDEERIATMTEAVQNILENGCKAIRMIGSGVLDMCYTATGRLDVVYAGVAGEGWKPWDYCAALVVCEEVGCVVEPIPQAEGADFDLYSKSIICATSLPLLKEVRATISRAR